LENLGVEDRIFEVILRKDGFMMYSDPFILGLEPVEGYCGHGNNSPDSPEDGKCLG
jgi:hypothetical protein